MKRRTKIAQLRLLPKAIFLFLGVSCIFSSAFAEETTFTLEPIVIVPTRSCLLPSQTLRKVNVITAQQISQMPVYSVPELLKHTLGVDIRQRGALGTQTDVAMPGRWIIGGLRIRL